MCFISNKDFTHSAAPLYKNKLATHGCISVFRKEEQLRNVSSGFLIETKKNLFKVRVHIRSQVFRSADSVLVRT